MNISRNLRTPIASLQAMIEIFGEALDNHTAVGGSLRRIGTEAQRLNQPVHAFLELHGLVAAVDLIPSPTALS